MKKALSLFLVLFSFSLFSPVAFALDDLDRDDYWDCAADPCPDGTQLPLGAKGWEPSTCDQVTIETDDTVSIGGTDYPLMAPDVASVEGKRVHPNAIEPPESKIDYNCDGKVSGWVPDEYKDDVDLMGKIGDVIKLIGQIAVFVSAGALIYGGIMFATASGEEMKIQKAKKTIIGAIVGLIVGLLAWNIVGFVTNWVR